MAEDRPLRYLETVERERQRALRAIRRIEPWRELVNRRPQVAALRGAYLAVLRELARQVAAPTLNVLSASQPSRKGLR